jgi:hypothetical protein
VTSKVSIRDAMAAAAARVVTMPVDEVEDVTEIRQVTDGR